MPSERFANLSEDKKKLIRDAAIREFVRVPFEKVSINQIIQNAGISRGSFYTYFEDNRDVLRYIFQDNSIKFLNFCEENLKKRNGNLWTVMEDLLDYAIRSSVKDDLMRLVRNVAMIRDTSPLFEESSGLCGHDQMADNIVSMIYKGMDRTEFRITDQEQFHLLLEMNMSALMMALNQYYHHPDQEEKIKNLFHEKLELLQYGVCK